MRNQWGIITSAALTVLVLVFAAFLPRLFIQETEANGEPGATTPNPPDVTETPAPTTDTPSVEYGSLSREERVELFLSGGVSATSVEMSKEDQVNFAIYQAAAEQVDLAYNALVIDRGGTERVNSEGVNIHTVTGADGRGIRYLEIYRNWDSDWHNWFHMKIDIDSCEVYYVYYSTTNLQNYGKYSDLKSPDMVSLLLRSTGFEPTAVNTKLQGEAEQGVPITEVELVGENTTARYDCWTKFAPPMLYDFSATIVN